jgi:hypothetical protein
MLLSVDWLLVTDVSGQPIRPVIKGQDCMMLDNGTDKLFWNVSPEQKALDMDCDVTRNLVMKFCDHDTKNDVCCVCMFSGFVSKNVMRNRLTNELTEPSFRGKF